MVSRPLDAQPEFQNLLEQAAALSRVKHSAYDDEAETRRKLNDHGISDAEIARQLATLKWNTANKTAVLASYSLLHGLQHLDVIEERSPRLSDSAEAIIALFRAAEVCLHNLGVLSSKMVRSIERGRLSRALSHARWRSGFHEVLYRLSALVPEVSEGPLSGAYLDLRHSPIFQNYRQQNDALQTWLIERWAEADADLFNKDLDDPKRYVFFNELVSSSDERIWLSRLSRVRLPGVVQGTDEDAAAFYARTILSSEIEAMLTALETLADSDLLPFRAVHQIAEIIASHVNRQLCEVVALLLSVETEALDRASRKLFIANRMLTVVDDAIKLMMRVLTPAAYKEIRPNLGMVRGTSSVVLRKTLFNTTYPLLVRACKLRLCGDASLLDDDPHVEARARAALQGDDARRNASVIGQLILLHQHIRTWRDNHQQLPKTHLGMSAISGQPTVSLSGSDSAVHIAHGLRTIHSRDPIAPLYQAALGTLPPDVHELYTPGGFDEHMVHKTARAVFSAYPEVQSRFYERTGKKVRARDS